MPVPLRPPCPSCQTSVADDANFCPHCGVPLRDGEPEAERRQLTVLFSDLVESTVLADALDPEDLREIERAHHTACASVIARLDGYVAQYIGDGVLAYFGYPVAHEDDA